MSSFGPHHFLALQGEIGQIFYADLRLRSWQPLFSFHAGYLVGVFMFFHLGGDISHNSVVLCSSLRHPFDAALLPHLITSPPADLPLRRIAYCPFRILCITLCGTGFCVLDIQEHLYHLHHLHGTRFVDSAPHTALSAFAPCIAYACCIHSVVVVGSYGIFARACGVPGWVAVSVTLSGIAYGARPSLVPISGSRLVLRPAFGSASMYDTPIYVLHPRRVGTWYCRVSAVRFLGGNLVVTGTPTYSVHLLVSGWIRRILSRPLPVVLQTLIELQCLTETVHCVSLINHDGAYVSLI